MNRRKPSSHCSKTGIVCDMHSADLGTDNIITIDLFNLVIGVLKTNGDLGNNIPNLGFPVYSPDDSAVLYQRYNTVDGKDYLLRFPLNADKMSPGGDEEIYSYGIRPLWFVRGDIQPTGVETASGVPSPALLYQNSPNPFNPVTSISFAVSEPGWVKLTVFDILGQEVALLVDGYRPAGTYCEVFNGGSLASGIYFYKLTVGEYSWTMKMTVMK